MGVSTSSMVSDARACGVRSRRQDRDDLGTRDESVADDTQVELSFCRAGSEGDRGRDGQTCRIAAGQTDDEWVRGVADTADRARGGRIRAPSLIVLVEIERCSTCWMIWNEPVKASSGSRLVPLAFWSIALPARSVTAGPTLIV